MSTVPAKLLKIHEAAQALGVADKTLRRWEKAGKLVPKRSHGNQRLYDYEQVMVFKAKRDGVAHRDEETKRLSDYEPQSPSLPVSQPRSSFAAPILLGLGAMLLVWGAGTGIEGIAKGRAKEQAKQYAMGKALGVEFEGQMSGEVLAAIAEANQDVFFAVTVPAIFSNTARFVDAVTFESDITAPNIIYSITAGEGIAVTGGQNPTISVADPSIDAYTKVKVGDTTMTAGEEDTLTFAASGNTSVAIDTTNKKITFSSTAPDLSAAGGWTDSGTSVYVTTTTDTVGIGTTTPTATLDIDGTLNVTGLVTLADSLEIDGDYVTIGTGTPGSIDSSGGDLYVTGDLEIDGTIYGQLSGGVATGFSQGSVIFTDSTGNLTADNTNFFWDDTNNRLGIGDNTPSYALDVNGTANFTGNVIFGDAAASDTVTFTSRISSNFIPSATSTYDLGDNTRRWNTLYVDDIIATNFSTGSVDISGTTSEDFVINSDNATADTESSTLTFHRGTSGANAEWRWDATNKWLSTNVSSVVIDWDTGITASGKSALIVNQDQSQDIFTASASGVSKFTVSNSGNVTTVDNAWYGLGASAGQIEFDDQSTDEVNILNANLGLGTQTPSAKLDIVADSVTTGNAIALSADGLTTGKGFYLESTSTAFSSGALQHLYWNPGSATTATGDILRLDVGSNGIVGNILNVLNGGSSVFSVGQAQITAALPTQFTAAGDVNIAYDLIFSNQTASYIKSYAPLYIEAGETFENNDLTLRSYGTGAVVVDAMSLNVMQAASVSGRLLLGTQINPDNLGQLYATNNITYGKALAIFNQTESQSIFTASASGTTRFVINNDGRTSVGNANPVGMLNVDNSNTSTFGKASLIVMQDETEDILTASASGTTKFTVQNTGDIAMANSEEIQNSTDDMMVFQGVAGSDNTDLTIDLDGTAPTLFSTTDTTIAVTDALDIDADIATALTVGDGSVNYLTVDTTTDAGDTLFTLSGTSGGITSGKIFSIVGDTVTTGNVADISADGLSTGKGLYLESTSTAFSSGALGHLYWNPGSATTATGDILRLDVGSNGIVGNILNVMNGGSSVFSVGQAQITAALPTQFTAPGDVSIAYDIQFTNQTASYIKSLAPLIVEAGESFENNNLTLKTYGVGNVLIDSMALNVSQAASISGRLLVGTQTNPDNLGQMYATNNITYGKSLAIFNQTESQDILTASKSGTTRFTIANDGRTSVGNGNPVGMLNVDSTNTSTFGKAGLMINHDEAQDLISASASGTAKFTVSSTGTITTVDNAWIGLGASAGQIEFDDQTVDEVNIVNANLGVGTSTPAFRLDVTDSQSATVAAMITNSSTGTNADGLAIKLGFTGSGTAPTGDPPAGNRFMVFMNGGGTIHGAIDATGADGVAFKTSGSDFAEYFKKANLAESLPVGTAVCLTDSGLGGVTACSSTSKQSIVGVVSLYAGFVGGFDHAGDSAYALVGLVGQLPVSVDPASAPLVAGDRLAVGSVPGTVAKATTSGGIIGKALASWTPGQATVNVYVQQGYTSIGDTEASLSMSTLSTNVETAALTTPTPELMTQSFASVETQVLGADTVEAVHMDVIDTLVARGTLAVVGDATFKGEAIFEKLVTFLSNIVFRGVVSFEKAPIYATKDAAGYAEVSKYTDRVDVVFDDTYEVPPVVTISLNTTTSTSSSDLIRGSMDSGSGAGMTASTSAFLSDGVYAVVTDVTAKGFSIILPSPALQDYTYSWSAIRVTDPKRVKSSSIISDLLNEAENVAGVATDSADIATESAQASGSASVQE